jgi:hypothetical protein
MEFIKDFFSIVTPISSLVTLVFLAYLTKKFVNDNNIKQAERTNKAILEEKVETLTIDSIKLALREEIRAELINQLVPIKKDINALKTDVNTMKVDINGMKVDINAIKMNQSNLVTELRTL